MPREYRADFCWRMFFEKEANGKNTKNSRVKRHWSLARVVDEENKFTTDERLTGRGHMFPVLQKSKRDNRTNKRSEQSKTAQSFSKQSSASSNPRSWGELFLVHDVNQWWKDLQDKTDSLTIRFGRQSKENIILRSFPKAASAHSISLYLP